MENYFFYVKIFDWNYLHLTAQTKETYFSKANLSISEILKYVHTKALEPSDMNNVGLLSRKMSKMSISQYLRDLVRCTKEMRFFRSTRQVLMEIQILSIFF